MSTIHHMQETLAIWLAFNTTPFKHVDEQTIYLFSASLSSNFKPRQANRVATPCGDNAINPNPIRLELLAARPHYPQHRML